MVTYYNNKTYRYFNKKIKPLTIPRNQLQSWKPCLIHLKCYCKEITAAKKKLQKQKSKRRGLSEGKSVYYPRNITKLDKKMAKTFQIHYDDSLSSVTKSILHTCQNKYVYYSLDDLKRIKNLKERKSLLAFLFSSLLSLHNNFSVNFFDIWIDQISLTPIPESNRFLVKNTQKSRKSTLIRLTLYYQTRLPIKKPESLW